MILKQRRVYFISKYIIYVLRVNKAQAFIQVMTKFLKN